MLFQYKTIGLIGTHKNPKVAQTVSDLIEILSGWGIEVILEKDTAVEQASFKNQSYEGIDLTKIGEKIDCGIVIGGDGNLLRAARALSLFDIPLIGVNRGQLGYLTDINPNELSMQLRPLLEGKCIIESRFLIQAKVLRAGKEVHAGSALNDVVLFPGDIAQMIEFELKINDIFVYSQRSDGLIVSTPTGSTAYSLSAGGPILQPDIEAVILVPMFPHTLTSRPIVIDADSQIRIHISKENKTAPRLSYDGQSHFNLALGDEVLIKKQRKRLKLLHAQQFDYFSVLRSKLGWGRPLTLGG